MKVAYEHVRLVPNGELTKEVMANSLEDELAEPAEIIELDIYGEHTALLGSG